VVSRDVSRLGKSGILEVTMAVSQHFIAWSCAPAIDNVFLYWTLQHRKREFENVATGSTIPTIGLQFFKRFKIACPREINEQQTIGRMLLAAYDEVVGLVQGKEKLSLIKAGLMHDLLTGRVPVPVGNSQKAAARV
jgi:type I restriction enzyme S subunit